MLLSRSRDIMALENSSFFNSSTSDEQEINIFWATTAEITTNFIGALANILLILVLFVHKPLRDSSSWRLIVHCIAIDLYLCAIAIPVFSVLPQSGLLGHPLPDYYCDLKAIFVLSAYTAGIYASCVLAIQRLIAAFSPGLYDFVKKKPVLISMVIFPWLVPFIINSISVSLGNITRAKSNFTLVEECFLPPKPHSDPVLILSVVFGCFIPIGIIGICYVLVLGKTWRDLRQKENSAALQRRMDVSRTLCLSFLWHSVTLFPVTAAIYWFPGHYQTSVRLQLAVWWLANSFSAINPFFFFAGSRLFQDGVQELIMYRYLGHYRAPTSMERLTC